MTVLLPGERRFPQSVDDASVEKDFYTAVGHDGQNTDVAERAFSEIEGPAAEAWDQIARGVWPLPAEQRVAVASWLALHLLRGARGRTAMNDIGTDLLRLQIAIGGRARLRETLRELGEPYDDESVTNEWIDQFADPVFVRAHPNHHLLHIADLLPRVTGSLLDRWWVLTTYQRKRLATCDQPVYIVPNKDDLDTGRGSGIENADEIHVPLTRRHSLTMALRATLPSEVMEAADHAQRGVTSTARYSNSCTVISARRMLFHHPDDDPLNGLELHPPRTREVGHGADPWQMMPEEDRQVLRDAGLQPPESGTVGE